MPFEENPEIERIETALVRLYWLGIFLDQIEGQCRRFAPHGHILRMTEHAMIQAAKVKAALAEERWRKTDYSAAQMENRRKKR